MLVSVAFGSVESFPLGDVFDNENLMVEAPGFPNKLFVLPLPADNDDEDEEDPKTKPDVLPGFDDDDDVDDEPNPDDFPLVPTPAKPPPKLADPPLEDEPEVAGPKPEADPKPKTFFVPVASAPDRSPGDDAKTVEAKGLLLPFSVCARVVDANELLVAGFSGEETAVGVVPFVASVLALFGATNLCLTL